jgi:ABC-type Mn2+/Zn2+ transport system ATPase subunit
MMRAFKFKYPGVPDITFVEPDNLYTLKMALRQAGLGVIVEGPSGIGKTTALKKAVEQLKLSKQLEDFEILSARRSEDVQRIAYIEQWHNGFDAESP